MRKNLLTLFLLLIFNVGFSQDFFIRAKFLSDTIELGAPVKYGISVYHNPEQEIIFPDSNYNYYPFEFIEKKYFPTHTNENLSQDSVIYYLRTFELRKKYNFALPVFTIKEADSTKNLPVEDTIILREFVKGSPHSYQLMENTIFVKVKREINYPYIIATSIGVFLLVVLIYFSTGKTLVRRYRLFIVQRAHSSFIKNYERFEKEFNIGLDIYSIEKALSLWKNYLSRLENKPINTYTTTEIISLFNNEELKEGLQIVDRAIYSGVIIGEPKKALNIIKKFTNKEFIKRKKEIRNG